MCGRVAQYRGPMEYGSMLKIDWTKSLSRELPNAPPHCNGAPSHSSIWPCGFNREIICGESARACCALTATPALAPHGPALQSAWLSWGAFLF